MPDLITQFWKRMTLKQKKLHRKVILAQIFIFNIVFAQTKNNFFSKQIQESYRKNTQTESLTDKTEKAYFIYKLRNLRVKNLNR